MDCVAVAVRTQAYEGVLVPRLVRRDSAVLHGSLLVAIVFWGLAFTAIKLALAHMSWITLTFLRLAIASGLYVVYLTAMKPTTRIERRDFPKIALIGFVAFTAYHLFLNLGEMDPNTTAGTSALVIASAPAFLTILAVVMLKEKVTSVRALGIAFAFVGLAVMLLLSSPGSEYRVTFTVGAALIIPAAFFAALYSALAKPLLSKYQPFQLTAYAMFFGTIFTLPFVAVNGGGTMSDLGTMGIGGALPLLFLGLFPTFLSYGLWFRALQKMEASAAGAYVYLSTLLAVVAGIIVLGETVAAPAIIGGAMVIGGVYVAQRRSR